MQISENRFATALRAGESQIGLWVALADANVAEALAPTGFDWLLIDAEHGPNDVRQVLEQLRAIAPYPVQAVVRPPVGDVALIKQYLDIGAQTLLVPMIDTPQQAALMARAMRYPPAGIRGVGAGIARASRWNQIDRYLPQANAQACLLVQAESQEAMRNLEAIATTDGVDGVFFGPSDLAASMGMLGQPGHPDVETAVTAGIALVRRLGKAAGVLATDHALARKYQQAGANFVAVGVDTGLLVNAARDLARVFKSAGG